MKCPPMTIPMCDFFFLTNIILFEKYVIKTHFIHVTAQDINFNIRPAVTAYIDVERNMQHIAKHVDS